MCMYRLTFGNHFENLKCEGEEKEICNSVGLRVFENGVLRGVLGPGRDEVTGGWGKLHNEGLVICTPYPILCGW